MTEPQKSRITAGQASKINGIPRDVLTRMASDDLFPQVEKGTGGHVYFPTDQVPTWTECIEVLEEHRDRHLRRAHSLLERLTQEIEAVRNDIAAAREHPNDPLGVDLLALGHRPYEHHPYSRPGPSNSGQPTVAGILEAFSFERMIILSYDDALREAKAAVPLRDPKEEGAPR